jgi:hypothetical protein
LKTIDANHPAKVLYITHNYYWFYLCTNDLLNHFIKLYTMLKKDSNISYYEYFQAFLNNKFNLFLFLTIGFTSIIVYPLVMPHLTHPSMIYHIALHIISFDIALFLTTISLISYKKIKSKRVLFTFLSFGFLLVVEFMYILQSSDVLSEFRIPLIGIEIPHILLLIMLSLFAIGVMRVERR